MNAVRSNLIANIHNGVRASRSFHKTYFQFFNKTDYIFFGIILSHKRTKVRKYLSKGLVALTEMTDGKGKHGFPSGHSLHS